MKDQVLKLCRRLKRCTLEDIIQFTELSKEQVIPIIYYLLDNNLLEEKSGIYSPLDFQDDKNNIGDIYFKQQYHSENELDMIIKGFCLEIPASKIKHFINCKEAALSDFYRIFRQKIYERQHEELLNNYFNRPQNNHYRLFFNTIAYFYIYNNQVYVTSNPLRAPFEDEKTKTEKSEFRKIYCYLQRIEGNHSREKYLHHHLAEGIWRRNKKFEELHLDLKSLLFS